MALFTRLRLRADREQAQARPQVSSRSLGLASESAETSFVVYAN